MTRHACIQEHKLGEIESKINMIDKELFNGDGGLSKSVPVLANNVDHLTKSVEALRTTISGLDIFKNEIKGAERREDEIKKAQLTNFQMFGIIMAAIVGLFSILGFIKSFVNDKKVDDLDYKLLFKQDRIPDSTTRSIKSLPLDTAKMFK